MKDYILAKENFTYILYEMECIVMARKIRNSQMPSKYDLPPAENSKLRHRILEKAIELVFIGFLIFWLISFVRAIWGITMAILKLNGVIDE